MYIKLQGELFCGSLVSHMKGRPRRPKYDQGNKKEVQQRRSHKGVRTQFNYMWCDIYCYNALERVSLFLSPTTNCASQHMLGPVH